MAGFSFPVNQGPAPNTQQKVGLASASSNGVPEGRVARARRPGSQRAHKKKADARASAFIRWRARKDSNLRPPSS